VNVSQIRFDRRKLLGMAGAGGAALVAGGVALRLSKQPPAEAAGQLAQAGHLLRRAGFAPSEADINAALGDGLSRTIDRLLHPESVSDTALDATLAAGAYDVTKIGDLRRWWLTRMALTRRPLLEKMTLFWHGLLTSSYRKTGQGDLMYLQNQFLRTHALGSLSDLLTGITIDGAMLRWLDGTGSSKAHPNENYARELMELFTMGVGNFTESDVRAAARALTGWALDRQGQVSFRPQVHDNEVKTFLGRTGRLGMGDVISAILANPATPRYLAGRMWSFFVYPNPTDGDLAPVVDAFRQSHGNIGAMMEAVLRSPAFSSPKAYRALVKSPAELIAGFSRQLGHPIDAADAAAGDAMGQGLFDPPSVAGWAPGAAWLSTGSWMARMHHLLARVHTLPGTTLPGGTTSALVDHLLAMMVDGSVAPAARQALVDHRGTPAEVAFLVAATPEYQLS